MVCSADELLVWKDFPKGLKVLLLNEDSQSAAEVKSKLQQMDYTVCTYCNEKEALEAISSRDQCFHVAIVEVNIDNPNVSFKFLETAKDLPTIMISNTHCLSTMMKCIALGAAEFLQKPLSEDKLRNIWQHVVHKAFNAGTSALSKSLKPIKETVASILQLQTAATESEDKNPSQTEGEEQLQEHEQYPAPPTPQLERGRLSDDGDGLEQTKCPVIKDQKEQDGESEEFRKNSCSESKSVDNTCNHSVGDGVVKESPTRSGEPLIEEEVDSAMDTSSEECHERKEKIAPPNMPNGYNAESVSEADHPNKPSVLPNLCSSKASKKKMKVDWTSELHRRFVQAVEQLGIDQAIPSRILEVMKVEGLTRHNVASHLQKYRMHRRHMVPKEDDKKWPPQRASMQRGYTQRPLMAYPPHHSIYGISNPHLYPVWGHPSCNPMWGHPAFTWQPPEPWPWKSYPGVYADAWGCPVAPTQVPCPTVLQHGVPSHVPSAVEGGKKQQLSPTDLHPATEELIDKMVKEVMNQPWLPLPLGLKPPSTESVLTELHRQGIPNIPPAHSSL